MGDDWPDSATSAETPISADPWAIVYRVLNRLSPISSLNELRRSMGSASPLPPGPTAPFALGFDTNAVFRLGLGINGPDAVDYVANAHQGPVIVPGQVVQEVWNNSLSAVLPQARVVRKKLEELEAEMLKVDQHLGPEGALVREALTDLIAVRGDWVDPAAMSIFELTLDTLLSVGKTPYVPRVEFARLAQIRKDTKTPPGFQDINGLGDFFVWADFLLGLVLELQQFSSVVFVTNDTKKDWSRNGVAHPVLVAEAKAVSGAPFYLWTLSEFQLFASNAIKAVGPAT